MAKLADSDLGFFASCATRSGNGGIHEVLRSAGAAKPEDTIMDKNIWKTILDEMQDAVTVIDAKTFRIVAVNKAFLDHFQAAGKPVIGSRCHDVVFPSFENTPLRFTDMCPLQEVLVTGKASVMEHHVCCPDGQRKDLEIATSPIRDQWGKLVYLVHVCRDITARKAADRRLEHLACFDALTGLPNRMLVHDRLEQAVHSASRNSRLLAVILIELDHFKKINDSLGHAAGDQILTTIARRLRFCALQGDTVGRLGGDEFALLISSAKELRDVLAMVNQVREAIAEPIRQDGREVFLEATLGISLFPEDAENASDLLLRAELAMYEGKKSGRKTYCFFSSEMNRRSSERHRLEMNLHSAIQNDELYLMYQPQLSADGKKLIGVEALLRWRHPKLGMISPGTFIPLAEESGLIVSMGEWVLHKACRQVKAWQQSGLTDLRLAVNLSPVQIREPEFVRTIQQVVSETGFDARKLELELTEGVLLENDRALKKCLEDLKSVGLKLALDDFGTGYSSLSYLRHFPFDRIKIAQEFVRGIPTQAQNIEIVKAIVAMAVSLRLGIVAEGVETAEQLDILSSYGCQEIQGFYFSKPLNGQDFRKFACTFWT